MKSVKSEFKVEERASRLELIVRFFLSIAYSIILCIISIILSLVLIFQFFIILFSGKRNKDLAEFTKDYLAYYLEVYTYLMFVTDERPSFWPKGI